MCGGPIVPNKAHCVSGAENDQSNPNLQVAWQRLQPLLPPLITTGNQLACLDTRSARHETSLGSSGDTVLLGKQPQGFTERTREATFLHQHPSYSSSLEGGRVTDLHPRQQRIFRFFLLDVQTSTSFQDGDAFPSAVTQSSPHMHPWKTATFCPSHRATRTK